MGAEQGASIAHIPTQELAIKQPDAATEQGNQFATLGAGCFWCVEAVYQQVKGVVSVSSGYMGGHVVNPTYEQVCLGSSGHAEVVQVVYDPSQV